MTFGLIMICAMKAKSGMVISTGLDRCAMTVSEIGPIWPSKISRIAVAVSPSAAKIGIPVRSSRISPPKTKRMVIGSAPRGCRGCA